MSTLRHLLSPGTPVYGLLKIGAIAGAAGLQIAVSRRARRGAEPQPPAPAPAAHDETGPARSPHPRSRKRRGRRRRG